MTPPPSGYPSAPHGAPSPSTPSGTSTDNNNKDWALPLPPPPGRSAGPLPVRLLGKGLLTVATGIMIFVFAMTAATAIGTSDRLPDADRNDGGTIPVSYFGAWYKPPEESSGGRKRDYKRDYEHGSGPGYGRRSQAKTETEWIYIHPAAVLVHFWIFALSDFPSALVAIFVLANIAIFRRAIFYFIALIVLAICFLAFLVAPLIITVTTLSTKYHGDTIKKGLEEDCMDNDLCKTVQSWEITAIVLMWVFWLISALLRAGYLFMLFQAWKKQKNNDGNSVR